MSSKKSGLLGGEMQFAGGELQDGMLAHYLEQAKASDVNVEARLEREAFDFRLLERYLEGSVKVAQKYRRIGSNF